MKPKLGRAVRAEYGQIFAVLLAKETTRKRLVNCFDRIPHSLDAKKKLKLLFEALGGERTDKLHLTCITFLSGFDWQQGLS